MNSIDIRSIEKKGETITYHYEVEGDWRQYFQQDQPFFVSYEGEDVTQVPDSIAVIPLMVNLLPMAWVTDATIRVPELDLDFYNNIIKIRGGYCAMYPQMELGGKVEAAKLVNHADAPSERTAAFFSGGADAFSTLITHTAEHPSLITLFGSDIRLDDREGEQRVREHALATGREFGCPNLFIHSSFRLFLREGALTELVLPQSGDNYWHGFQHGIGLIGHAAPYAYLHRLKTVYIASSFTAKDRGKVTCASDPTIDNHVHMASCTTVHDGYEFTRQQKIARIVAYQQRTGRRIALHVCWQSRGGGNCCACEKCYRTICEIFAENGEPREMGFAYDDGLFSRMKRDFRWRIVFDDVMRAYWKDIKARLLDHPQVLEKYPGLRWMTQTDFSHADQPVALRKKIYRWLQRVERRLSR